MIFYEGHVDQIFSIEDVINAILNGKIIEEYPNDKPLPSFLIFGYVNDIPLHVVLGFNNQTKRVRIITVYIPDLDRFHEDFMTRIKND